MTRDQNDSEPGKLKLMKEKDIPVELSSLGTGVEIDS